MPLEAATGEEKGDSAENFSSPTTVITVIEPRQMLATPEPFVSPDEAAQFLCVKRRYLLELARRGIVGAYALGTGGKRRIWVFRLSELAASVVRNETSIPKPAKPCTIGSGSPR
jgi:excisionase family DNA binding protein